MQMVEEISFGYIGGDRGTPQPQEPYDLASLHELLDNGDPIVRSHMCSWPRLPAEIVERLAHDPDTVVRTWLVYANHDLWPELLVRMLDTYPELYDAVCQHHNAPLHLSENFYVSQMPDISLRAFLTAKNSTPEQAGRFMDLRLVPGLTAGEAWRQSENPT